MYKIADDTVGGGQPEWISLDMLEVRVYHHHPRHLSQRHHSVGHDGDAAVVLL